MTRPGSAGLESAARSDLASGLPAACMPTARLNIQPENVTRGLGQLVLIILKLLHELLERQAIRRLDSGVLGEEQVERLGLTLMRQGEELERLREAFGLKEEDLNLDLGPIGRVF